MSNNNTKNNINISGLAQVSFLFGVILCALSIDYQIRVLALIGSTFLLWSGLFRYISPTKLMPAQISKELFNDTYGYLVELLKTLEGEIKISYKTGSTLEQIKNVFLNVTLLDDTKYLLDPPGNSIYRYLESRLNVNLSSIRMSELVPILIKEVVDELDFADNLIIEFDDEETILLKITGNYFNDAKYRDPYLLNIGDPLTSSLICIFCRVTKKNILIVYQTVDEKKVQKISLKIEEV